MRDTLRKLLTLFDARARRRWLWLVPVSVASAGLEAMAAFAVFGLVRVLAGEGGPAARGVPLAGGLAPEIPLPVLGVVVVALFVTKNGMRGLEVVLREMQARHATVALSKDLLQGYLEAPWRWLARRRSADLIRNVQESVSHACQAVQHLLGACAELLVLVAVATALVIAVPGTAAMALAAVCLVAALLLRRLHRIYGRWGGILHERSGEALAILGQSLGGARELRLFGGEALAAERYAEARSGVAATSAWRGVLDAVPYLFLETLLVSGVAGVAALGAGSEAGALVLLGSFAYAVMRVLPAAHRLVYHLNSVRFMGASIEALDDDLRALGQVRRPALPAVPLVMRHAIRLEQVTFAWTPGAEPVLHEVDLEIRRGQWLAIVGASGAGKSTLVDLLLGLLTPDSGRVCVDGTDLLGRERDWQSGIGFVPQQVFLTGDSVRRNVAFGVADAAIDDQEVRVALDAAGLLERLAGLPEGLETPLGECGSRLSGGERQRIAIARALYRRPALLVLDEATSALDGGAEADLARTLTDLKGSCTVVTVAHRLGMVRPADRVVWLEGGGVRAEGSLAEVSAREPGLMGLVTRSVNPAREVRPRRAALRSHERVG